MLEFIDLLVQNGYFEKKFLVESESNKICAINSALLSLCLCNVLIKEKVKIFPYVFLGHELINHIGLITMVFDGYGELMSNGIDIASGKIKNPEKLPRGASIAAASIQFGEKADPVILDVIKNLGLKGAICDIGCGSAHRLIDLCKATSLPGLGLDTSHEAVMIARKAAKKFPLINIEHANAFHLKGVWENVELLMQCFMTHDLFPDEEFIKSLGSYRSNFPNLKYLLILDIVAPEDTLNSHMPAYDYVHGLLGIETRQYARYTSLFTKSGYKIIKEISIDMPNTYLWILMP